MQITMQARVNVGRRPSSVAASSTGEGVKPRLHQQKREAHLTLERHTTLRPITTLVQPKTCQVLQLCELQQHVIFLPTACNV